jgi:hypothetical protein
VFAVKTFKKSSTFLIHGFIRSALAVTQALVAVLTQHLAVEPFLWVKPAIQTTKTKARENKGKKRKQVSK